MEPCEGKRTDYRRRFRTMRRRAFTLPKWSCRFCDLHRSNRTSLFPFAGSRGNCKGMKHKGTFVGSVPSSNPLWRFRNILSVTHPQSEPFHNNFSKPQLKALLSRFFADKNLFYENLLMNLFFMARGPDSNRNAARRPKLAGC